MLHLILPKPLHRAGLRLAHAVRKLWWATLRPRVIGVQILAFDDAGRVLLLRHTYGSGCWMAPGGGLGRHENPLAAAARELREEVGCDLLEARLIMVVDEDLHGATNEIHVVAGRIEAVPCADGREVLAAALFAPDALPPGMTPRQAASLPGRITAAIAGRRAEGPPARPPTPAPPAPTA